MVKVLSPALALHRVQRLSSAQRKQLHLSQPQLEVYLEPQQQHQDQACLEHLLRELRRHCLAKHLLPILDLALRLPALEVAAQEGQGSLEV